MTKLTAEQKRVKKLKKAVIRAAAKAATRHEAGWLTRMRVQHIVMTNMKQTDPLFNAKLRKNQTTEK